MVRMVYLQNNTTTKPITKTNKPMKTAVLLAIISIVLFAAGYETSSLKRENNSQQQTIDSLQTELFKAQSETGRYEIALELLSQENEPAAAQFDSLYNNETE